MYAKEIKKRAAKLCALLLFTAALFGCGQESKQSEEGFAEGRTVKAPVELVYLTDNQIETQIYDMDALGNRMPEGIEAPQDTVAAGEALSGTAIDSGQETVKVSEAEEFSGQLLQISGLTDKETEQTINSKIEDFYNTYAGGPTPPYRGIKSKIDEDMRLTNERIFMYAEANYNNILSIVLNRNLQYESGPLEKGDNEYVYQTESLNLDLNTGEEIALSSLFADNVDWKETVNSYLAGWLASNNAHDDGWYGINQTTPFTGIGEEQKYYLTNHSILFIFDYDTPEFESGFSSNTAGMPFTEDMAIAERYFDSAENIYEAQAPWSKSLIVRDLELDEGATYTSDGDIYITVSGNWSSKLPDPIKEKMEALNKVDARDIADELRPYIEEALLLYDEQNISATYEKRFSASMVGNYINISERKYRNVNTKTWNYSEGKTFLNDNRTVLQCYRADGKEPLELSDFFVEGFDYETAVKEAIVLSIQRELDSNSRRKDTAPYEFGSGSEKEKDLALVEGLYDSINSFSVQSNALYLGAEDSFSLFKEIYATEPSDYENGYVYLQAWENIRYEDLGCDNLTIFQ